MNREKVKDARYIDTPFNLRLDTSLADLFHIDENGVFRNHPMSSEKRSHPKMDIALNQEKGNRTALASDDRRYFAETSGRADHA